MSNIELSGRSRRCIHTCYETAYRFTIYSITLASRGVHPGLYTVFSRPVFPKLVGVDADLGPLVGCLLGIMMIAGINETGKTAISEAIRYTEQSPLKQYALYVPLLILYFIVLFVGIAPLIQPTSICTFFNWCPAQCNFQHILQDPTTIAGYKGIKTMALFYILLRGITGPLVDE